MHLVHDLYMIDKLHVYIMHAIIDIQGDYPLFLPFNYHLRLWLKMLNIICITITLNNCTNQTLKNIFFLILYSNEAYENSFLNFFQRFTHV